MELIQNFDNSILYYLYENWHNAFTDGFFTVITHSCAYFWPALGVLMLFSKKWRPTGILLLLSLGISALLGSIVLKSIFCRPRPFTADPGLNLIIDIPRGVYSFPSGHSTAAGAGASAVFTRHKGAGAAAAVYSLLIAFSRVFFSVHYPTDVICGLVLGIVCSVLLYRFVPLKPTAEEQ